MQMLVVEGNSTNLKTLKDALVEASNLVGVGGKVILLVDTQSQLESTVIEQGLQSQKQLKPNSEKELPNGVTVRMATKRSGFHPGKGDVVLAYFATDQLMDFVDDKTLSNKNSVVVVPETTGTPNWNIRRQPNYVGTQNPPANLALFHDPTHEAPVENLISGINLSMSNLHSSDKTRLRSAFKGLKEKGMFLLPSEVRNKVMQMSGTSTLADQIAKLV